jgi:hypothetical protein
VEGLETIVTGQIAKTTTLEVLPEGAPNDTPGRCEVTHATEDFLVHVVPRTVRVHHSHVRDQVVATAHLSEHGSYHR